ncbi:hypothetical protein HY772_02385 [Candidatus Woesearchaeota archaeon]|nr:hypothetical protein [Candidatus Woesearchaeota archaeon]
MLREGEVRYAWTASLSTTPAYELTKYTYTGQYSHMDDPSTAGVTEGFGLMFYNARWLRSVPVTEWRGYDPSLGRFAQADIIVPTQTQGVQAWDRYAYANNNPVRYTDPSGHRVDDGCSGESGGCTLSEYQKWKDAQDQAMAEAARDKYRCAAGNYSYCSTVDLIIKRHPKPVSGIHVGYSGQAGYGLESGVYDQWDFLVDW